MDLPSFGVDFAALEDQCTDVTYPKPVPGRIAHIDADFIAYQVSAETRDEMDGITPRKSLEDMQHNAREAVEHLMRCVGATSYKAHVTPSGSNKGGRNEQAVQQEYQSNRKGKEKPEFLDAIRAFIGQELNGVIHLDQEADDGMARANYDAVGPNGSWGTSNLSVIVSKDKDLRMVPGLHYDFDTGTVFCVGDPFGSIWLQEKTKVDPKTGKEKVVERKLKGWGTKFFWAQCLMGDPADAIKGLPAMSGMEFQEIAPSAAYKKLSEKFQGVEPAPEVLAKIRVEQAKTKLVGPVLTHEYLKNVPDDKTAFNVVREAWQSLEKYSGYEFTHWRTGARVTPTQALLGDMQLLWMRRNGNPLDVVDWLKEQSK